MISQMLFAREFLVTIGTLIRGLAGVQSVQKRNEKGKSKIQGMGGEKEKKEFGIWRMIFFKQHCTDCVVADQRCIFGKHITEGLIVAHEGRWGDRNEKKEKEIEIKGISSLLF